MSQPTFKTIQKIKQLEDTIKKLYEKKEKLTAKLIAKYGTGEWVLDNVENKEQPYIRLTLTDNTADLNEGKTLFRVAAFRRYDLTVKELKNKPKPKDI